MRAVIFFIGVLIVRALDKSYVQEQSTSLAVIVVVLLVWDIADSIRNWTKND